MIHLHGFHLHFFFFFFFTYLACIITFQRSRCTHLSLQKETREMTKACSPSPVETMALFVGLFLPLLYSIHPKPIQDWFQGFWKSSELVLHQQTTGQVLTAGWLYVLCQSSWNQSASPFFFHFLLGRRRTLRNSRDDWRKELFRKQT